MEREKTSETNKQKKNHSNVFHKIIYFHSVVSEIEQNKTAVFVKAVLFLVFKTFSSRFTIRREREQLYRGNYCFSSIPLFKNTDNGRISL